MPRLTTQDYIASLGPDLSWRVVIKFIWIISIRISGPIMALFTNFAGFLPYKQWICVGGSKECKMRVEKSGISRDSFCGVDNETSLVPGVDMQWQLDGRKTYAVEWNLLCEQEYIGTFISSSFFVGALLALLVSTFLFDKYGRLRVAQIAQIVSILLSLLMVFPMNPWYLIAVRGILGGMYYMLNTGHHILTLELIPKSLKGKGMVLGLFTWTLGQCILAFIAYVFKDWRFIVLTGTVILCNNLYPIFFLVQESPLYLLSNKGDEVACKKSLKKIAKFFGSERNFDDITLVAETEDSVKEQSIGDALNDFKNFPTLTKHVVILCFIWLKSGWLYYGFTFSWGMLGKNLYLSYFLNGCGEALATIALMAYFEKLPRRALAYFDLFAAVTLLIAITPESIGFKAISLSQIASLVGAISSAVVFAAHFLWTQELSPTTHRGKILCITSSCSRIGALLGPQASLLFTWNKTAMLCMFAAVALASGFLTMLLPETKGDIMPSQACEIFSRSEQLRLEKAEKLTAKNEKEFDMSGLEQMDEV